MRAIRYGVCLYLSVLVEVSQGRNPLCVQLDMEWERSEMDAEILSIVAIRYACN